MQRYAVQLGLHAGVARVQTPTGYIEDSNSRGLLILTRGRSASMSLGLSQCRYQLLSCAERARSMVSSSMLKRSGAASGSRSPIRNFEPH
jgi:hypothetical protein